MKKFSQQIKKLFSPNFRYEKMVRPIRKKTYVNSYPKFEIEKP